MGYQIQRERYAWTWRSFWKLGWTRQQFAKIKKNTISDAELQDTTNCDVCDGGAAPVEVVETIDTMNSPVAETPKLVSCAEDSDVLNLTIDTSATCSDQWNSR